MTTIGPTAETTASRRSITKIMSPKALMGFFVSAIGIMRPTVAASVSAATIQRPTVIRWSRTPIARSASSACTFLSSRLSTRAAMTTARIPAPSPQSSPMGSDCLDIAAFDSPFSAMKSMTPPIVARASRPPITEATTPTVTS